MTPARIRVPSEDGFALVETLIATAIVALMASMLFGIVIQDTRTRRALADRRLAVAIAQSHLEQAAVVGRSDDLPLSGTDQGFRWRVVRTGYEGGARDGGPPLSLVTVEVTPADEARILAKIQTLQIAL